MTKIFVAGSGTEVGKTVVSAILTTMLSGDYWKPIQCGEEDSEVVKKWIDLGRHRVFPATYSLKAPLSPAHAARLENISINPQLIIPPETNRPLIIEGVGGIFAPLASNYLSFDLFRSWNCQWVVVSKHYLGSINHTLLTVEMLKRHAIPVLGIFFNGEPSPDTENCILEISKLPFLGRLEPETQMNQHTIKKYANLWQQHLPL